MKDTAPQLPADEEPADDPLRMVQGKQRLLRLPTEAAGGGCKGKGQADCWSRSSSLSLHKIEQACNLSRPLGHLARRRE